MQLQIKSRFGDLDQVTQDYCKKRMNKLEKILPENAYLEIEFIDEFGVERRGLDKLVQADLTIPGEKQTIHLENNEQNWQNSIDLLQERLEKELKRRHDKMIESGRHPRKYKAAEYEQQESGEI
jgi:ribosomal subunit interface protein